MTKAKKKKLKKFSTLNFKFYFIYFLIILSISFIIAFFTYKPINNFISEKKAEKNITEDKNEKEIEYVADGIELNTTDNSQIINYSDNTKIHVINEYDKSLFKGKKNLILMFGSWCYNCEEELDDLADIVEYYKNTDIEITLIAHEYEYSTLKTFLDNSEKTYNTTILLDLNRVIRKAIDPEENTVPVCYLLDANLNILYKYDSVVTLDKCIEFTNEYFK